MALTVSGGKLLLRNGALGTEQACCCSTGCCSLESVDQEAQPDVTVADSGCPCESGSHDGDYVFLSSFVSGSGRSWLWSGSGSCEMDYFGFTFRATLSIRVQCRPGGDWIVGASTYALPGGSIYGINGNKTTCNLSINNDGKLVGTVDVDMYGDSDSNGINELICTLTLTFGP